MGQREAGGRWSSSTAPRGDLQRPCRAAPAAPGAPALRPLCRSGAGAWLARIAPFEELFFDDRLVCGLTVREALEQLERRYAACCRPLVTLAG